MATNEHKKIIVKNADGDADTAATILIQNKIDYTPKVSVIIPVYNVEQYLRECLDSVINQTLKEIEIICVDDGSTDSSLDILKEYANRDNRITVITQENLHAGVARNAGLAVAKGEYLSFLDSDDFFELNMLEETYNKAKETDSDVVMYENAVYDSAKQEISSFCHIDKKFVEASPFSPDIFKDCLFTAVNPNPWTKLFSRDLFIKNGLHFEKYLRCNDITCVCVALAAATKISVIQKPLAIYRSNQKANVTANRADHIDCFLYAADKLEKKLKKLNLYDTFKPTFIHRIESSFKWECSVCSKEQLDNTKQMAKSILSSELYEILYKIKVSVIIPVYNVEQYLRECLDSVINQTLKDIEIICVNDGSPDNSLAILKEYAAKDKRITIIDQQNQGLSCSRNNALKIANGEYVLFLDSDDWVRNDTCEVLYTRCKKHDVEMMNFAGINFDDETNIKQQVPGQSITYIDCSKDFYDRSQIETFMVKIPISACRFFYKREFLIHHNIMFPQGLCFEDNVFVRKALLYAQRFCGTNEILYNRRVHKGAITQNINKVFSDYIAISKMVVELYKESNVNPDIVKHIANVYLKICFNHYNSFFAADRKKYHDEFYKFLSYMMNTYNLNPDEFSYRAKLQTWCNDRCGPIDLDNPKTYNEKIQWSKLYDSTPIKTRLADKYLVRDWVAEKIGDKYLIPLLGVYDSFEEIDFDKLPNQFVIKCNHGCAYNIIVKDKSKLDLAEVKAKLDKWMCENFALRYGCELHYRDIKPKIIIEKFIENKNSGGDLYDYKFWCFGGKVHYIQFLSERNTDGLKMAFYDRNWKKQHFVYSHPLDQKNIEKPSNLDEMIKLAENLSNGFNHVRVDFYRLDDGTIYFGEMTFTSASGKCQWNDEKINRYFGKLFKLPKLAYNIDTGTYYKLPKTHRLRIKPYLLFPYYLIKTWYLRRKRDRMHAEQIVSQIRTYRVDIMHANTNGSVDVVDGTNCNHEKPKWMNGRGVMVTDDAKSICFNVQCKESGVVNFFFRGMDRRYNDARIPVYVKYTSIKIDSEEMLSAPVIAWHDVPFKFTKNVVDGQEINVYVKTVPYVYTPDELAILLDKLYPNENIPAIIRAYCDTDLLYAMMYDQGE